MSGVNGFSVTQLVIRNSSLSGSAWAVSVAIADRYDQRVGYSSVSSRYLAAKTGLAIKTVTSALMEIEESGEWEADKAKGATTKYHPALERLSLPQEKRSSSSNRGRSSVITASKKTPTTPKTPAKNDELVLKTKIPEEIDASGYPLVPEDTDPYLDNLVILPSEDADVVRPRILETPLAMAIRIHKRTDISTRAKPNDFTVEKITALIEKLHDDGAGYPLEAIDILLWIQCHNKQPLNLKFFSVVLAKCVHNGEIVEPQKWHETNKRDPAHDVAMKVYEVFNARHQDTSDEYTTSL